MPSKSLPVIKLVAITAFCLLAACSNHDENSSGTDSANPASRAAEPGIDSAQRETPVNPAKPRHNPLAVSTSENISESSPGQAEHSISPQERLVQLIVTGYNGDDDYNSWQCTAENIRSEKTPLSLRFWSDFTGVISSHRMNWQITDDNAIKISVAQKGVIHLVEIEFDSGAYHYDLFSAIDNLGELTTCQWKGMVRYISPEIVYMDKPTNNIPEGIQ